MLQWQPGAIRPSEVATPEAASSNCPVLFAAHCPAPVRGSHSRFSSLDIACTSPKLFVVKRGALEQAVPVRPELLLCGICFHAGSSPSSRMFSDARERTQLGLAGGCTAPCVFVFQPFAPIARSNVYFIVSPTASGPLIAAVAISGYCRDRTPLTSSAVILLSGSPNLIPWNENSRRIALACMAYILLVCRLSELLTIRATECGKRCHERWRDPTVSSYCACITHFGSSLGRRADGRISPPFVAHFATF